VFTGTTQQKDALQPFPFPSPVDADHVQVQLIDNWGGKDGIAASEVEIVGHKVAVATPKPTATHAATFSVTVREDIGLAPPRISSANTDPSSKAAGIFACDIQAGPSTQPPTAATFCGGLIQSQIDIGGNKHSTPPQVVVSSGARMIHVAVDEFDGSPYGTTPLQSGGFADFRLTGPATVPAAEGNYGPLVFNQTTGGPFILDHLGAVEFPFGGRTGDYTLEWNSPTRTGWVTVAILSVSSP
jgi:hypothetical protein